MNEKQLDILRKNNEESREFTRSCISFALITLLQKEQEIAALSITKLCSVAGVSRAAFYRNYDSIDDVLSDKVREMAVKLNGVVENDVYNNWLNFFQIAEKNHILLETMVKAGCERKILEVFLSFLPEDEDNRTLQTIWISLIYSLIIKWIKEKKPENVEDAAKAAYMYTKNIPMVTA